MAKIDSIKRQMFIVDFLRKQPASFEEINAYLQNKETQEDFYLSISQRTFQRDRNEIESVWGIEIKFNKRENYYEIVNEEVDNFDRIMEAFDTVSVLNQSKRLGSYIYLEKRKSKGTEFFTGIVYAIKNNFSIRFQHHSYWKETISERHVMPIAIKEVQSRFYLVSWDLDKNKLRNFGLDRITDFVVTNKKNSSPKINVEEYYQHSFGIKCHDAPVKIVLEFENDQKEYVKSLPFHSSQKITKENESTFILELFMYPTDDFIMEIMRCGSTCEVKAPSFLRDELIKEIKKIQKKYHI